MASPFHADISRRDFFAFSAILAGGATLGDLLPAGQAAPAATAAKAEALDLSMDASAWITKAGIEKARIENLNALHLQRGEALEMFYLPQPEDPFTRFLDQADVLFQGAKNLGTLTFNNIPGTTVGNRLDVERLAACPHLARVHTLILMECFLDPEGVRVLTASPHLGGLRRLVIWRDAIGDEGAKTLATARTLAGLRELSLMENRIGPAGAHALAASPHWKHLEILDLMTNPIGDAGVRALADSPHLPALGRLGLFDNGIGPEGARALANSPHLKKLQNLGLCIQQIGDAGAELLRKRFGDVCWIEDDEAEQAKAAAVEASFRQPIVNQPDDDAPRLRYADWLAERDPSRSEMVRLQVELAASPTYDSLRPEKEVLANNLVAAHGDKWAAPIEFCVPWILDRDGMTLDEYFRLRKDSQPLHHFRRGVVEHVNITPRRFARYFGDLYRTAPTVRSALVRCHTDSKKWDARFASSPQLARLTELELTQCDRELLQAVSRSTHLNRLQTLRITQSGLHPDAIVRLLDPGRLPNLSTLVLSGGDDEALAALLAAGHLNRLSALQLSQFSLTESVLEQLAEATWPKLHTLSLSNSYLDEGGLSFLLESPLLGGLRSLDLGATQLLIEDLEGLAACPHLAGLESLTLSQNALGAEGVEALVASPHLANLKALHLAEADLDAAAAIALAGAPHLTGLRWLDLGKNLIGDEGASALAESTALRGLHVLELNGNDITAEGAAALADAPLLQGLTTLYLFRNPLGDKGLTSLAESSKLGELRVLGVGSTESTGAGAAALAKSPNLPQVSVLTLYQNTLGDDGPRALARSKHLGALRVLGMALSKVGDKGAQALAKSDSLAGLIGLDLRGNDLSDKSIEALQAHFGTRVRTSGWRTSLVEVKL